MRSHAPAPSRCTRDYARVACCPRSFPPTKQKHEGQLAKAPPLLLKARPAFAAWGPSPVLAPWVPLCHPAQRLLHLTDLCTWGFRSAGALQHPQDGGEPPAHPTGLCRQSTSVVVLWLQLREAIGQGADAAVTVPAPQQVSWSPVLSSTVQMPGSKSQLDHCWLLTPSIEADP